MNHSRRTRRCADTLFVATLAAAVLGSAHAPAADAAVIGTSWSGFEGGPALASDGRVVVGERRGNGALRIIAIDRGTLASADLITFGPLLDPATYPVLNVSGTGAAVTMSRDTFRQVGRTDAEQPQPTLLSAQTMSVLPSVVPLGRCGPPSLSSFAQLNAAAGDGFVATIGDDCGMNATSVRIRTANGTFTIPALPGSPGSNFVPAISNLRAAGPMVAWLETRLAPSIGSQVTSSVVVARAATREVLVRAPINGLNIQMGLGSDGTAAVTASLGPCSLGVVSPAAPGLRAIQLPPKLCAGLGSFGDGTRGQGSIAVANGRIVYPTASGYAVSDLQGGVHALAEASQQAPEGRQRPSQVAFDGRTVYVVRSDCAADRLLAVDADVVSENPAGTALACPVRRSGPSRLRVARDARVTIALRCPAGCRGTLRLVQQRHGGRERTVGEADYGNGANPVLVRPAIARWARPLAGCKGGLGVVARLFGVGDDHTHVAAGRGRGLGAYRITSRAACRRGGGPAFGAPRPGPRP